MSPAEISPSPRWFSTNRQHTITGLTAAQIGAMLDGIEQSEDDPEKVVYSWQFQINGQNCAVWDYKGSHLRKEFSAFGPLEQLQAVFGGHVK